MSSNLWIARWPVLVIGTLIGGGGILALISIGIAAFFHSPSPAISGPNSASNPFYSYLLLVVIGMSLIFTGLYMDGLNND
jgi:hypothetical protein